MNTLPGKIYVLKVVGIRLNIVNHILVHNENKRLQITNKLDVVPAELVKASVNLFASYFMRLLILIKIIYTWKLRNEELND